MLSSSQQGITGRPFISGNFPRRLSESTDESSLSYVSESEVRKTYIFSFWPSWFSSYSPSTPSAHNILQLHLQDLPDKNI